MTEIIITTVIDTEGMDYSNPEELAKIFALNIADAIEDTYESYEMFEEAKLNRLVKFCNTGKFE